MTVLITDMDFQILDLIRRRLTCKALDAVMPVFSYAGNGGFIWILTSVILFIIGKRMEALILLSALLTGAVICNLFLKKAAARKRPCQINGNVKIKIGIPKDYSFPSGHTMSSFTAAAVLLHISIPLGCSAAAVAALIGFSRLYLYVHFPSDVAAGAVLGSALGTSVWYAAAALIAV